MSRSASSRLQAPWLLIAPSLVLALFIISYPIFNIVWQSLHEVSRFGAIRDFTGLQNFIYDFHRPLVSRCRQDGRLSGPCAWWAARC